MDSAHLVELATILFVALGLTRNTRCG